MLIGMCAFIAIDNRKPKSKICGRQLCNSTNPPRIKFKQSKIIHKMMMNNKLMSIMGMPLMNANGAIDASSTGYKYVIDTLSRIRESVIDQKFYKISISDYVPMDIGEAAWSSEIVQNISYDIAGDFFQGDVDTMAGNGQLAEVNAALAPIRMPTIVWAKACSWNVAEIAQAAAANKWDVVESKMTALKRNWDLGIQEVAFLGHARVSTLTGLLNNSEVTINTTLITEPLSEMSETEFTTFIRGLLSAYWTNSNDTEMPDTFVMPTTDYLGMSVPYSSTFPNISKLEYLENSFKKMTRNDNFKILPLAYSDSANNAIRGITKNRYCLYKNDPETLSFTIPVDYTMYDAGTSNNIFWQQPAIGQYSGVLINRVPEVLYFDETAAAS